MKRPNGFILWRGASLLDGAPIVVIGIRKSGNRKTGRMLQTYIHGTSRHSFSADRML